MLLMVTHSLSVFLFSFCSKSMFFMTQPYSFDISNCILSAGTPNEKLPVENKKPAGASKDGGEPDTGAQQLSKAELKRLRREKQVPALSLWHAG